MNNLPKLASVYIILITIAWIVVFYAFLRQRDRMKRNKFKYDLKTIHFEVEPIGDETWSLNFYYGDQPIHSEIVTESDVFNDKTVFYKAFVKWCEEESDEKKG